MNVKIIEGNRSATFAQAYNLSYADIWDFSVEKMSLKKFEIKLGILHMELDLPWDQPVDEKDWERVVEYCANDVVATEAVFEDRKSDFVARQILAELSGLTVNDTTQNSYCPNHIWRQMSSGRTRSSSTQISRRNSPAISSSSVRATTREKSQARVAMSTPNRACTRMWLYWMWCSMHPKSIELLNLFGPYTKNYAALTEARVAIKHQDYDKARKLLDGRLAPVPDWRRGR